MGTCAEVRGNPLSTRTGAHLWGAGRERGDGERVREGGQGGAREDGGERERVSSERC